MTLQQCARLQAAVQHLTSQMTQLAALLPELQRQQAALDRAAAVLADRSAETVCNAAIARARNRA